MGAMLIPLALLLVAAVAPHTAAKELSDFIGEYEHIDIDAAAVMEHHRRARADPDHKVSEWVGGGGRGRGEMDEGRGTCVALNSPSRDVGRET